MILNPFTGQEVQEETIVMKSILWPDVKELFYEYFSGDKQKALEEMKAAAGSQGMRKESFFLLALFLKKYIILQIPFMFLLKLKMKLLCF